MLSRMSKKNNKVNNEIKTNLSYSVSKLPFERFIPVFFILFLIILIFLSITTYKHAAKYKDNVETVNLNNKIQEKILITESLLQNIQLTCRNYLKTGDFKNINSYSESESKLKESMKELSVLVINNNRQEKLMIELDSLLNELYPVFSFTINEYKPGKNFNEAITNFQDSTDKRIEEILNITSEIKNNGSNDIEIKKAELFDSSMNFQLFMVLTGIFTFCVTGLAVYLLHKIIKNKTAAEKLLHTLHLEFENRVEERTKEIKSINDNLLIEISNRIKTEGLLRESEERFRTMADSAPIMIWMSGKDKQFNYFNKGWLEYTGSTLEAETGSGCFNGVHPDDLHRRTDTYILAFDKRESFEMEYRLRNAKNEYRWILDKGVPHYEGDEFAGYIGGCIDIQSRKMGESYLNMQHEISKILTESISMNDAFTRMLESICININWQFGILWIVNKEKRKLKPIVVWSQNTIQHKEYSHIYDFELPNGYDLPGLVWKSVKSVWSANLMMDYNFDRKELAKRLNWNSALDVPVTNGTEVIAVIECFNNDLKNDDKELLTVLEVIGRQLGNFMERKNAENILKESHAELENRVNERTKELAAMMNKLFVEIEHKEKIQNKLKLFAHAIKGIKECVYITDLDNKILFVNTSFESTFGYFEEELMNKETPVLFSDIISPETRSNILVSTIRTGWRGEILNKRKDNSQFPVYLSTSVIRNDEGQIEAIVGICQDITEQKASEELVLKQNTLIKLLNDVIVVTNKSFDLEHCISYSINKVCQYTSLDAGHCYLIDESGKLVSTSIWNYNLDKKYEHIRDISEKTVFEPGIGLAGETFKSTNASWIELNESNRNRYPRADSLMSAGLYTCILIPIMKQMKPIGILEFFKKEKVPADKDLLECISNIGIELGSLSERIEIIDKIKVSEKQFKAVADTANDAIITSNSEGKIVYANKSVETIFGYSNFELMNSSISVLIPDRLMENHVKAFEKANKTSSLITQGKTTEFIAKDKSNREFPVEISLAKWDINNEYYYTAMIKDITLRKEIEYELLEKQKMLIEAQEITKLCSWQWDVKTNIVTWSESMNRVYETDSNNFSPTYEEFIKLVHPDDVEKINEIIQNALNKKEPFNYFHRIITPKGKIKILKEQGEIITDEKGNVLKVFGTGLDVTELKEAEEKIILSENLLKESQQIAKLGSWEYNAVNGEIYWSDELFRICGIDKENGIPVFENITEYIHPDDKARINSLLKKIKKEPQNLEISFRLVTPIGTLKYIDADILTETDNIGKVTRYYGSIQDVTEIKKVEEELRKANDKLLEAQKEIIHNEKLAALGRFSSGIAHEIRNPLANISALSQLLVKAQLDEKSQKHLKYILINTEIANKIIKDLLNFASPEELVFKNENIKEIIENVIESIKPRCTEGNIKIIKNISDNIPQIDIDKLKIENALMNFLSNAIDAMPEGGELTIKAFNEKLNKSVSIIISDTGTGISQENMDKIMEPFFTTKKGGTGLGLGLAYQAVKSHKGSVKIDSKTGKGTMININLPLNINN